MTESEIQDLLAAEYVVGTLTGQARARFERELMEDAGLRARVTDWEGKLAPWIGVLRPVAPPPRVWRAITRQINRGGNAIWRWSAGIAAAAVVVLAVALYQLQTPSAPPAFQPTPIAVVNGKQGQPLWIVEADVKRHEMQVRALPGAAPPPGKSYELWMLPGEGKPVSMGVLPAAGSEKHPLPAALAARLAKAKGLAVSIEPPGGSPTGQPTGPVVFQAGLLTG